jgi:hypothetical protein
MPVAAPLIFVYNADSGVLNLLKDLWIKTVTPEKYECQLCAVTYGPTGMRREWKEFIGTLDREVRFLHRDELEREFGATGLEFPAAFQLEDAELRPLIEACEMRAFGTLDDLMLFTRFRLQAG